MRASNAVSRAGSSGPCGFEFSTASIRDSTFFAERRISVTGAAVLAPYPRKPTGRPLSTATAGSRRQALYHYFSGIDQQIDAKLACQPYSIDSLRKLSTLIVGGCRRQLLGFLACLNQTKNDAHHFTMRRLQVSQAKEHLQQLVRCQGPTGKP